MTTETVVTCGEQAYRCRCVKPLGHVDEGDEVHECDAGCGGAWTGTYPEFFPVRYPAGTGGLPGAES